MNHPARRQPSPLRQQLEAALEQLAPGKWRIDTFEKDGRWHGHVEWNDGDGPQLVVARGCRSGEVLGRRLLRGVAE